MLSEHRMLSEHTHWMKPPTPSCHPRLRPLAPKLLLPEHQPTSGIFRNMATSSRVTLHHPEYHRFTRQKNTPAPKNRDRTCNDLTVGLLETSAGSLASELLGLTPAHHTPPQSATHGEQAERCLAPREEVPSTGNGACQADNASRLPYWLHRHQAPDLAAPA